MKDKLVLTLFLTLLSAIPLSGHAGERPAGKIYYFQRDRLGSVTAVTDEKGNVVERYRYDAYGKALDLLSSPSSASNPYRYTGRWYKPGARHA